MYNTNQFRRGLKIEIDGDPWIVSDFQHVKPGKGNAFTRTRLKHLLTGRVVERTFRSGEKVGKPDLEEVHGQYLYEDGTSMVFMNNDNYEQIPIPTDQLEDVKLFLKENTDVTLLIYNGRPVNVDPPSFVNLEVTEAEPGLKGDTASGAQKTVTLETGLKVNVPLFINQGDVLRIDTREGGAYVDRVNK